MWDLVKDTKTVTDSTGQDKTVHASATRAAKSNNAARKHGDEKTSMLEGHAELERHSKSEESGLTDEAKSAQELELETTALNQIEAELVKAGVTEQYAKEAAQQILAEAEAKNGGKLPEGGHIQANVKLPEEAMAKAKAAAASFAEAAADEGEATDEATDETATMTRTSQQATLEVGLEKAGLTAAAAKQVAEQIMSQVPEGKQIDLAEVDVPESLLVTEASFMELGEGSDMDMEHMTDAQLDAMLDSMTDEELEALAAGHDLDHTDEDSVAFDEEHAEAGSFAEAEADAEAEDLADAEAEDYAEAEEYTEADEATDELTDDRKAGKKLSKAEEDCKKAGGTLQASPDPPGHICIRVKINVEPGATPGPTKVNAKIHLKQ
jgi:hypothetical protein